MTVIKVKATSDTRILPVRHLSARVPWHDQKWNGKTCKNVLDNSFCRILPLVDQRKDPENELPNEPINASNMPPCVSEKGTFLSGNGFTRLLRHRYQEMGNPLFKDFKPSKYDHKPYSFNAVPFAWLMKSTAHPNVNYDPTDRPHKSIKAKQFEVNYKPELEDAIDGKLGFEGNIWVQSSENQKALLDTFFGCLQKQKSLIFFYAKHTPLSEAGDRVIVGVARVAAKPGPVLEYEFPVGYNGHVSYPWDRCVEHTLRTDGTGEGVLLPYHELLEYVEANNSDVDLNEFVAKAPDFAQFAYASELVEHDTAIDALLNVSEALRKASTLLGRNFKAEMAWIDGEISKIWDMRGAFPGLGSVLSGIGIENGNTIAWEIERHILGRYGDLLKQDPWEIFEGSLENPEKFLGDRGRYLFITAIRTKWAHRSDQKKGLDKFLSRCQLTNEQAKHLISEYDRKTNDVMENPYLLYEGSRFNVHGAPFSTIDKAVFPPKNIIEAFPLPAGIEFDDHLDARRSRSLSVMQLEEAAADEGHSLLPFDDLLTRLSEKQLSEPFPIDEDTLEAQTSSDFFAEEIDLIPESENNPTRFLKLKRLAEIKTGIRQRINRDVVADRPLGVEHDWLEIVNGHFPVIEDKPGSAAYENEVEARYEKAEALRVLANSRVTILIGPAGSGKTEVLRILKKLPGIGSFLELAPTGKARVNLSPTAQTLAQFLLKFKRYDTVTGCYLTQPSRQKYSGDRNIVLDECSMLTEEQLAALLDALGPIDRLVLVGDHRQLPPIGTGRPFFDLASHFMPADGSDSEPIADEGSFRPLTGPGYAELTKIKRQADSANDRLDLQLSRCFTDKAAKEDLEIFWALSDVETNTDNLRLEKWYSFDDFRETFRQTVEEELEMKGHPDLEKRFNEILGAVSSGGHQYFNIGAEKNIEEWQVISPVNGHTYGVKEINKFFQTQYRKKFVDFAMGRQSSIARPAGSDSVVYGDKVINLRNASWMDWQKIEPHGAKARALNYIANGEIGIITGEFRSRNYHNNSKPNVEIAFSTQQGYSYVFRPNDLGEDARYSVELAYAITIHKAQGSGFEIVFVVLPAKESVISREMIYTALTRQKRKVVIFHQGDFKDFARFASTEASATARRFTDLFFLPEVTQIDRKWYDAKYVNVSDRGERMISKNEVIIANLLNKYQDQIIYSYEDKLKFEKSGHTVRPDFVIENVLTGKKFYWEHLGMMTLKHYREKWNKKLQGYLNEGFVLYKTAEANAEKILVITEENPNGGINSQEIDMIIKRVILETSVGD